MTLEQMGRPVIAMRHKNMEEPKRQNFQNLLYHTVQISLFSWTLLSLYFVAHLILFKALQSFFSFQNLGMEEKILVCKLIFISVYQHC